MAAHNAAAPPPGAGARAGAGRLNLVACLCVLRGEALLALGNAARAREWLVAALRCDAFAVDALQLLLDRHLLADADEAALHAALA